MSVNPTAENPKNIPEGLKEAVVDSLLNNLSGRLAGKEEFYRVIFGGKPRAALTSEFLLPVPPQQRDGDEESFPVQISAHGMDLQIRAEDKDATLRVQLFGSVYVRVYPTAAEILPGGVLHAEIPVKSEIRRALKKTISEGLKDLRKELGDGRKRAKDHPDWEARSLEIRRAAHAEIGLPMDAVVEDSSSDETPEAGPEALAEEGSETGEGGPALILQSLPQLSDALMQEIAVPQKWLRLDLTFEAFEFSVADCGAASEAATAAVNAAIRKQLEQWSASDDPESGGKLWGYRRGRKVRNSDVFNWDAYLRDVRASALAVVLPEFDIHCVFESTIDAVDTACRVVHVAMENWSLEVPKAQIKETETAFFQASVLLQIGQSVHLPLKLDRVKASYRYNEYLTYPALGFNGGVRASVADNVLSLRTTWTPRYVLPRIVPTDLNGEGVVTNIEALSKEDCLGGLKPLVAAYEAWIIGAKATPVSRGIAADQTAQLAAEADALDRDVKAWQREKNAIECGLSILTFSRQYWNGPGPQPDRRGVPFEAWICANASMARVASKKGYSDWRLFQLAFILANIAAFASRMEEFEAFYTPEVAAYSNSVTLLYFATGGGKSEAFLGLLCFVLFLDRLRGKARGVSALLRYPLRLLTLQQAQRTLKTLAAAETVRHERGHPGEPFGLGFWVGGTNTPNWLTDEGLEPVPTDAQAGPRAEAELTKNPGYKNAKDRWLKMPHCPFCSHEMGLRRFRRLGGAVGHLCLNEPSSCDWNKRFSEATPIPFHIIDEDIYDFAPSVLLGTVDKLSAIGQSQGTIRKFFGMFGFAPWYQPDTGRLHIPGNKGDWEGEPGNKFVPLYPSYLDGEKRFFDPYPSLLIQDEAHLLDESLGTFAGLFETAFEAALDSLAPLLGRQVCREPGTTQRRRLKVIAASATVTDPNHQMRSLYQRDGTVQFPHPGPSLYESFYARPMEPDSTEFDAERRAFPIEEIETRSHWARVYQSILTNGHRHTVTVASTLGHFHLLISSLYERLRSGDATAQESARQELMKWTGAGPLQSQFTRLLAGASPARLLTLVDLHRISLTYVTNKKGGDQVIETEKVEFEKLHQKNGLLGMTLASELITGAVDAGHIQEVVRKAEQRVKQGEFFPDLNGRLRSIIATSAVSHGVDVEEFNAMFFAGMPSDIAEYIQASSRVGRTHVGFSILIPTPQRSRDRFIAEIHDIFHRFLERMISPAAIDRWAEKALVRTVPSFFQTYICGVRAITDFCEADPLDKHRAVAYQWGQDVHGFIRQDPFARKKEIADFIGAAFGIRPGFSSEGAAYHRAIIKLQLKNFEDDLENERLRNGKLRTFFELRAAGLRPMTSLRDVDEPGIITSSRRDFSAKYVEEETVSRVMDFIRLGSGGEIDDEAPEKKMRVKK